VARHHAALDLVREGKAGAARQRLDVEHDVAELAMTTRLLLVAAALDDGFADGFPITDGWRPPYDGVPEARGQALRRDPQVHLTLPPDHDFVGLGIVHHDE